MQFPDRLLFRPIAAMALLLALVAWAYWPGLSGPFLFDDFVNLDVLGAYGTIDDWPKLAYYLTSGRADPTGRPVSLLTFLLDAQQWPADPWPFKRTNLLLHLLNTTLLATVILRLQAGLKRRRPDAPLSRWTPLLAAVLWGAHPLLVSTTLYVVQRQAMLPMTFVLLALLAWDRSVRCFDRQRNAAGWSWAIAGMGMATLLAGLSKANGFLAPVLVGLAYLWFLRPHASNVTRRPRPMDVAAVACLLVPSALVLAYLVRYGFQLWPMTQLEGRDWTLPERLLSQPRALWSYIHQLAIPRAGGGGIYVEDFAVSREWLTPIATLPAMLALVATTITAILLRHRFPLASFAWLFFLAGHLLESTTIPLELYFEHRNYLPAMFLGLPIGHALLRAGRYRRARMALALILIAVLLLLTHQRAQVWGDEALLNAVSAQHRSDSPRSQATAAEDEITRGNVQAGLARIHAMQKRFPDSVDIAIEAINLECAATAAVSPETLMGAMRALETAPSWNRGLYEWMRGAAHDPGLRHCNRFGLAALKQLVGSAETNPRSVAPLRKRDLWHLRGYIALAEGLPKQAARWFEAALLIQPDPEYALVQAAALGDAGAQGLAIKHLDRFARIDAQTPPIIVRDVTSAHAWLLNHYGYHRNEISHLRKSLLADIAPPRQIPAPSQ